MGRKGVSKRKPKRTGSSSGVEINGSSKGRPGENLIVQSLVKDKAAPSTRDGKNPSAGWNRGQKKR